MKTETNTLLLCKDLSKLDSDIEYVSILPVEQDIKKKFKIKEVDFLTKTRNEILNDYEFCEQIYRKNLKKILKYFNEIHTTNFNEQGIEIILGYWLKNYIYVSFKILNQINYLIKSEKISHALLTDYKNFCFIKENTQEFAEAHASDLSWYYAYFSKVLNYFEKDFLNNIKIKEFSETTLKPKKNAKKKIKLHENILYFLQKNFRNPTSAFISHTYLPFFQEKKLELLFNQIPSYYKSFPLQKSFPINFALRKKYTKLISTEKKDFENFINSNLFTFLPKSFLENFETNLKLSENKLLPQEPKFIFTSSLNFFDEVFKVYAAKQALKSKPIFIGQHGNNYFSRIHNNYLPEFSYATKFFSWGYESSNFKNVKGFFNFKTIKQSSYKKNRGKKLIIFCEYLSNATDNLLLMPSEISKSLTRIRLFLERINKEIKNNVILRLNETFYKKIYGQTFIKYLSDLGVEIDNGKKSAKKILNNAKLCIFNYDSTGLLENSCNNIPSIMYLDKNYLNIINEEFIYKYIDLKSKKIIFHETYSMIDHVNKIWADVDRWWFSQKVQNSLKDFNNNFNEKADNKSLALIKSNIMKDL